ncbi:MAG: PKD domain-containing protein [Actinomycetota bacterium]
MLNEDGSSILPWDTLAGPAVYVEARIPTLGTGRPDTINALITAQQSGKNTVVPLSYQSTDGLKDIYRSQQLDVSQLVDRPTERTVAAVVNFAVEDEYDVAVNFMEILGVPSQLRRGIAWGMGSESQGRPPASTEFFKSAGYENARASLPGYRGFDDFFVKNQAEVLFYIGEGWHRINRLLLLDSAGDVEKLWNDSASPEEVGDAWSDVETVFLLGCSVLDIDNLEGLAGSDYTSPGREWAEKVLGPDAWLGFQWEAPLVGPQRGELAAYELAQRIALGPTWINAWRGATGWNIFPWPPHSFPTAVAIDLSGEGDYFHWHPWIEELPDELQWLYTWERWPRSNWGTSSAGLEIAVASPVEVHVYDVVGRHVGPNATGGYDAEIPGSNSFVAPAMINDQNGEAKRVSIRPADVSSVYEVRLIGTAEGDFDLYAEIPDRSSGRLLGVAYIDIPVLQGTQFSLSLERDADLTLWQDQDGDGEFETPISPTSVSGRPLDLPVNLTLEGVATEYGSFESDVIATLGASSRPAPNPLTRLEFDSGAGWQTYGTPLVFSGPGEHLLRYRGLFADASYDTTQEVVIRIEQSNTPPSAVAGPDQVGLEGSWVELSGAESSDPDGDVLSYLWEIVASDGPQVTLLEPTDLAPRFLTLDNGAHTLRLTVDDGHGGIASDEVGVLVENVVPAIDSVTAPLAPGRLGALSEVAGSFTDTGTNDTHTATWAWGDGSTSEGFVTEDSGSGTVVADHTYASAGVYTVMLTVMDDDSGLVSASFQYIVIYDPDGGFVTGGGWLYTPQGSYVADPSSTGKAHMGFNAKYQQGGPLPSGEMQLTLQGAQLAFHSEDYEWLVVAGSRAQMRGTGSIDGQGGYTFILTVVDGGGSGGEDMVRVKIWQTGSGEVVYDTQMGGADDVDPTSPLDGGSIVIHPN